MGYSHYWYRPAVLPLKEWRNWTKELRTLILIASDERIGILTDAYVGDSEVYFSGTQGCEAFYIARSFLPSYEEEKPDEEGRWFACCKTRQLPYDRYVVEVLMLAEKHFGDFITVESDGDFPHYCQEEI